MPKYRPRYTMMPTQLGLLFNSENDSTQRRTGRGGSVRDEVRAGGTICRPSQPSQPTQPPSTNLSSTHLMVKPRYRPAMPSVAIVLRYTSTRPLNWRSPPPFLLDLASLARRVRA
jgi:hypothetical protein